jgi:fucose permease
LDTVSLPATRTAPRLPAAIVGCLTLLAIGWTGLLVPSLIRSIQATFGVDDAAIGVEYLVFALAYAAGSFVGGPLTERFGRRAILGGAALIHGLGIVSMGLAPAFPLFVILAVPAAVGAGCLDGGANGVVLDVYRDQRGRAMNLLHMFFSLGALSAPVIVGSLVTAGVAWGTVFVVSGATLLVLAAAYLLVPMPSGRRARHRGDAATAGAPGSMTGRWLLTGPLLILGLAIALYVGAEIGVSNWLVRFLDAAPLTTATLALTLYWGGIAVGRLVSSIIADRFDHRRFTIACAVALGVAISIAVVVPSLPLSIACFALAGVASGPIFPMIVAIGGDRYPERSAAVGGSLAGMAVFGSVVYPPTMGFLSVTVGLGFAMFGSGLLAFASAAALVAFGRVAHRD